MRKLGKQRNRDEHLHVGLTKVRSQDMAENDEVGRTCGTNGEEEERV
jgi:hypothetical protein